MKDFKRFSSGIFGISLIFSLFVLASLPFHKLANTGVTSTSAEASYLNTIACGTETWTKEPGIRLDFDADDPSGTTGFHTPYVFRFPDGTLRMYYDPFGVFPGQMRSAVSLDGLTWIKEAGIRLTVGHHADVVQIGGGLFRMYFENLTNTGIGSATSTDGLNWTVESGDRITGVDPIVITLPGGSYRMYYRTSGPDANISSAISTDGLNWTGEAGIRVSDAVEFGAYRPGDGSVVIYYATPDFLAIKSACSTDGLNFTKASSPSLLPGLPGTLDGGQILTTSILQFPDGVVRMYYQGSPLGNPINSSARVFSATITDTGSCSITCPANITVPNTSNQCGANVSYQAPTKTSNCGLLTCSPASGSFFSLGTSTVTCTTTAGPSCSFTITVQDTRPPIISCLADIMTTALSGQSCAVVNYSNPVATNNCDAPSVECTPASGTCFPVGPTTVTCVATNTSGISALCSFTVRVCNPIVQSLAFEAIDSPLDENLNPGGGLRIFPDKQFPTDSLNRRRVRIVATTCPNTLVFFRAFDVDDPSSDSSPVDPNGSAGNDNRGTPQNGTLSSASAQANGNGIAQVEFMVTMHPGDNFKVAASTNPAYLVGVSVDGTDLIDSIGRVLPTSQAKNTPMLTVWRRMHVEIDSMGPVTGNKITGTVQRASYSSLLLRTTLYVDQDTGKNRFQNGFIDIGGVGSFFIISNNNKSVEVAGNVPDAVVRNKPFTMVDDDDFNDNNGLNLDGDEGEELIPLPDTFSLIQESDDPNKNVYSVVYIRPVFDGGGNIFNNTNDIPFKLNLEGPQGPRGTFENQISLGRNSAPNESDDFWVVYVQIGYQPDSTADGDPDSETMFVGGLTVTDNGNDLTNDVTNPNVPKGAEASIVFLETMRDGVRHGFRNLIKGTVPHEIGHQFGLKGDDTGFGIMSGASPTLTFVPRHINILRWRVHSPGQR